MNLHDIFLMGVAVGFIGGICSLTVVGILCYTEGKKVGAAQENNKTYKPFSVKLPHRNFDLDPVVPTSRDDKREGRR
jgi:hypothetical protein